MPECQLLWRPRADMCIKHNCTPTPHVVRNLSVSAHQEVLGWHWAEHFLSANNVIYCVHDSLMSLATDFISQIALTCTLTPLHANPRAVATWFFFFFFSLFPPAGVFHNANIFYPIEMRNARNVYPTERPLREKKVPVQPACCMSTPPPTAQSHVTLPFTCQLTSLTPPLIRDLLSYLTFATIRQHPCLVQKLECLIQRSRVHSAHTNATKSIEGPLVRTDR